MATSKIARLKLVTLLGIFLAASIVQAYFLCSDCSFLAYTRVAGFSLCVWLVLYSGNNLLTHRLSKVVPWLRYPVTRFFLGLTTTLVFTACSILVLMWIFSKFLGFDFRSQFQFTIL